MEIVYIFHIKSDIYLISLLHFQSFQGYCLREFRSPPEFNVLKENRFISSNPGHNILARDIFARFFFSV